MPEVDWMVLSILRESENLVIPIDPNLPELIRNIGGMTKSWEIAEWVKKILGHDKIPYKNTYLFGDFKAIEEVNQV